MKGSLQIACLVLAAACIVSSQTADDDTCGIYADSLAHPVDCNKYYKLNLHTCPDGQYFNAATDQCDQPENTKCGQTSTTDIPTEPSSTFITTVSTTSIPTSTTPTSTTPSTTPTTTPTTTPPTTPFPSTTRTTTYTTTPNTESTTTSYTTTPSTTTLTTTPTTTTRTTTPTTTTLTTTPTTTTLTTTPTTTTPTTTTPATTPTTTTLTTTPTTTRTTTPTTTTPTTTRYTTTPSTTTSTTTPTTTSAWSTTEGTTEAPQNGCPSVDDPTNRVRYAHEKSCPLYYLCTNGSKSLYSCTANNHFNPIKKICRPVTEAGCDQCPLYPVDGEIVRLPHESVCEYYYKCNSASQQEVFRCGDGQHFSRVDRICTSIAEAGCTLDQLIDV